jgi:pSer/pThr/pTyr-binding forkhead associated (FHA) protein
VAEPSNARLISQPGAQVQFRYLICKDCTSVGRSADNDVIIQGPDTASVSVHHCEIVRSGDGFRIRDLNSTNGTFLNGERITEAELHAPVVIRLGAHGPEMTFDCSDEVATPPLEATQVIPEGIVPTPIAGTYEGLLSDAVTQSRRARAHGLADQTMTIMRDALNKALRRTGRRLRLVIYALGGLLVGVSGVAAWRIIQLNHERQAIDQKIHSIESQLQTAQTSGEADRLASQLDGYEDEGEKLQRALLYRIAAHEDFVTGEIRRLMAEFGSEVYSVPPEFTERANYYIDQYQGANHSLMQRALGESARQLNLVRRVLEENHLPTDLAYVPLVESALGDEQSEAGALGIWQFTPATAKAYGLRVNDQVDERTDTLKSTRAACRYLRELILDFGAGSSVMLALAAYDLGPTRVKQAILKNVQDPIKQRNFWYLYRTRSLPPETREYVPKVMAAIIIGRNPAHFGF